jgi:hypothetical protein
MIYVHVTLLIDICSNSWSGDLTWPVSWKQRPDAVSVTSRGGSQVTDSERSGSKQSYQAFRRGVHVGNSDPGIGRGHPWRLIVARMEASFREHVKAVSLLELSAILRRMRGVGEGRKARGSG